MSLAMPTVRVVRFYQVRSQSEMKIKRLDKTQCEDDEMTLSLSGILKDAVCIIYGSLKKWCEKRRLTTTGSKVKADRSCSKIKVKTSVDLSSDNTTTLKNRENSHVQKRLASKPIPIPTRDRHGQRYPVYERKQFLNI